MEIKDQKNGSDSFYTLDRIEWNKAVLVNTNGETICVDRSLLPEECREGDVFLCENDRYLPTEEETLKRRKAMFLLQEKLKPVNENNKT